MDKDRVPTKKQAANINNEISGTPDQETMKEKPTPKKIKTGVVVNCSLLNVRSTPTADAIAYSVISKDTKVKIDESKSTELYYNIYSQNGISGFCLKKYIQVQ